jgi:transforming growth factor-beta-induced protein
MNRTFKILAVALISIGPFVIVSCDDDDDAGPSQDIVELTQESNNLSTLEAALTKFPDLLTTLSAQGQFTVFAPSNDAFDNLLDVIGQSSLDDVPDEVLRDILEYHVISGSAVTSSQLQTGNVSTVGGEQIAVNVSGGVTLNGSATVTAADVKAANGVVHVIDEVLVPPSIAPIVGTIVAPAYFNKNFTTLIAAVTAASPTILQTLLNSSDKTLFAPTNAAFTAAGINSPRIRQLWMPCSSTM